MASLFVTPNPLDSLIVTPNPFGSINIRPTQGTISSEIDNLTGARLEIASSRVRFQFDTQQEAIFAIDGLTGANIRGISTGDTFTQSQFGSNLQVFDFNGDGLDDLAVTAPEAELTFIYFGTSNGLVFNQVLDGTAPGINNVIGSGDFNGDGLNDLAIGTPDSGLSGQVSIYFGTSSGLLTTQILEPVAVF